MKKQCLCSAHKILNTIWERNCLHFLCMKYVRHRRWTHKAGHIIFSTRTPNLAQEPLGRLMSWLLLTLAMLYKHRICSLTYKLIFLAFLIISQKEKQYVMDTSHTLYITAFLNMEESQLFPSTFLLDFLTDMENLMSLLFVQKSYFFAYSAIGYLPFACIIVVWKTKPLISKPNCENCGILSF